MIPVRAELKRRVTGVIHGASSSGQTVFVEPLETIEQNNELVRLIEEEQAEIHRIFVALTRQVGAHSDALVDGLTEVPEAVVVCEKRDGSTEMSRRGKDELAAWLKDYGLGQLWRRGEIGGNRW